MNAPDSITPDKLPDPWLVDSEYLLGELARIRGLALLVPVTIQNAPYTNTVVDAVWRLETQLRYLLKLRAEMQWSFARRATESGSPGNSASGVGCSMLRPRLACDMRGTVDATPQPPLRAGEKTVGTVKRKAAARAL